MDVLFELDFYWMEISIQLNYTNGNNLWPFLLHNNNNDDDDDEQM